MQNGLASKLVLLPYRFTLFSNAEFANQNLDSVLLPYRFTLFPNDAGMQLLMSLGFTTL